MDNIAFHHSRETLNIIEKKGCKALFITSAYSPKHRIIAGLAYRRPSLVF
jgi:hypothetical protein